MKPLNGHVLLSVDKPEADERKTAGGIIIPVSIDDDDKPGIPEGIVMDAADDVELPIKKDDIVLYNSYSGREVVVDGQTCLLIAAKDLFAIVGNASNPS